jgi:hypothetical protein
MKILKKTQQSETKKYNQCEWPKNKPKNKTRKVNVNYSLVSVDGVQFSISLPITDIGE